MTQPRILTTALIRSRVHVAITLTLLIGAGVIPGLAQDSGWLTGSARLSTVGPNDICLCSGEVPAVTVNTAEAFFEKFDWIEYQSEEEALLAWQVFERVNQCSGTVFVGRLEDTSGFAGQQNACVLRDYEDWTPGINDAFIVAGLDRNAVFNAVSPPIAEIQVAPGGDLRDHRRNIYNRELSLLEQSGDYQFRGEISEASPGNPIAVTVAEAAIFRGEVDPALLLNRIQTQWETPVYLEIAEDGTASLSLDFFMRAEYLDDGATRVSCFLGSGTTENVEITKEGSFETAVPAAFGYRSVHISDEDPCLILRNKSADPVPVKLNGTIDYTAGKALITLEWANGPINIELVQQ